jgi:hypothetical protein
MMTQETKEILFTIATENAEELYTGSEGLWVSNEQLNSDIDEEEYESILSPERFEEILYGESPTDAEILALREHRIEVWLNEDADADVIPGYSLVEVVDAHGNRGIALIFCKGYSFSGLTIWVEDIFDTKAAAMAFLKDNGSTLEG